MGRGHPLEGEQRLDLRPIENNEATYKDEGKDAGGDWARPGCWFKVW